MGKQSQHQMNGDLIVIPFAAHEADMDRMKSTNNRLFILCIILVVSLIISNVAWYVYNSKSNSVVMSNENGGHNNYIGNDGDINYREPDNR